MNPAVTATVEARARQMGAQLVGRVVYDKRFTEAQIGARAVVEIDTPAAADVRAVWHRLREIARGYGISLEMMSHPIGEANMRIAVPVADGKLSAHFGHCEFFALIDADPETRAIIGRKDVEAPPHEPGLLPGWLAERGANVIIAGGMGGRAQDLFSKRGISVVLGAPTADPERLATEYLSGALHGGANSCDHGADSCDH